MENLAESGEFLIEFTSSLRFPQMSQDSDFYRNQICSARAEIRNLRQLISSLKHEHQKEIAAIKSTINGLRCAACSQQATTYIPYNTPKTPAHAPAAPSDSTIIMYKPIGYIECSFLNKRAVPRQPVVMNNVVGAVVINTRLFSNPEHALMGLEEFSHMWVIFHFHNTESNAVLAKVAPPRLRGERLGVFATRSPHRPCPIGLSLVKIQKIEGNKIYFYGVDMIAGTPVLDIKPYIPQYDYPTPTESPARSSACRSGDGRLSPNPTTIPQEDPASSLTRSFDNLLSPNSPPNIESPSTSELSKYQHTPRLERGAPDGQERFTPPNPVLKHDGIRVAQWIANPPSEIYQVRFTDDSLTRLVELIGDRAQNFKSNIEMLLKEDPRSHYVRTKYANHEYCCVLEDLSVSCVFDSDSLVCTIIAVKSADEMLA